MIASIALSIEVLFETGAEQKFFFHLNLQGNLAMTSQDKSSNSGSKKHSHHDHEHHDHENCGHHHHEHHDDHGHDHENGSHDHHGHEHGPHCNHDHENPEKYQRYAYNNEEIANFNSQGVETLILSVNDLLENEYYGKAVP
ncbi:MAG: hypothetical protein K2X69_16600, partial [Silvanigrellaceae bacterium]|nr:hypothetical protein [Silvanigrellaceae bacterium]